MAPPNRISYAYSISQIIQPEKADYDQEIYIFVNESDQIEFEIGIDFNKKTVIIIYDEFKIKFLFDIKDGEILSIKLNECCIECSNRNEGLLRIIYQDLVHKKISFKDFELAL